MGLDEIDKLQNPGGGGALEGRSSPSSPLETAAVSDGPVQHVRELHAEGVADALDPLNSLRQALNVEIVEGERPEPKCFAALALAFDHFLKEGLKAREEGRSAPIGTASARMENFLQAELTEGHVLRAFYYSCRRSLDPPRSFCDVLGTQDFLELLERKLVVNGAQIRQVNARDLVREIFCSINLSRGFMVSNCFSGMQFIMPAYFRRPEDTARLQVFLNEMLGYDLVDYVPDDEGFVQDKEFPLIRHLLSAAVLLRASVDEDLVDHAKEYFQPSQKIYLPDDSQSSVGPLFILADEDRQEEALEPSHSSLDVLFRDSVVRGLINSIQRVFGISEVRTKSQLLRGEVDIFTMFSQIEDYIVSGGDMLDSSLRLFEELIQNCDLAMLEELKKFLRRHLELGEEYHALLDPALEGRGYRGVLEFLDSIGVLRKAGGGYMYKGRAFIKHGEWVSGAVLPMIEGLIQEKSPTP